MSQKEPDNTNKDIREVLLEAIAHLEHVLPGQAPIQDFVHHNTLHGFQHLNFPDAIEAARKLYGASGYESHERFREYYAQGRIDHRDLLAVINDDDELHADETIAQPANTTESFVLSKRDIYLAALLNNFDAVSASQFYWQKNEDDVLHRFQKEDYLCSFQNNLL